MTAVTTKTTNVHGDDLIVTTTSPYEQVRGAGGDPCSTAPPPTMTCRSGLGRNGLHSLRGHSAPRYM